MRLPPARATLAIGVGTAVAWLILAAADLNLVAAQVAGFVPQAMFADLAGAMPYGVPSWLTPLTATLIHAGLLHLALNMLMLGFCGRFVEVALGAKGVVILYVVGAYAAAFAQYVTSPNSLVPMIGASGAISALFGAYALLFGKPRAVVAHPRLNSALNIAWLAAAWIGFQLLIGLATRPGNTQIAIGAHIGGFIAGLLLARPLLRWRYRAA